MNFIRALFSWQMIISYLLAVVLLIVGWFVTFHWLKKYALFGHTTQMPELVGLKLDEAEKILKNNNLVWELDSAVFVEGKSPLEVIEISPKEGSRIKVRRQVYLRVNPVIMPRIAVPNVIHKSLRIASLQLKSMGFVVRDTIYVPDIAQDVVLELYHKNRKIKPNKFLPKFSVIDLIVGSGSEEKHVVPNLFGYKISFAKQEIRRFNFNFLEPIFVGEIKDSAQVKVFYQYPKAGIISKEGGDIETYVSDLESDQLREYIKALEEKYSDEEIYPQTEFDDGLTNEEAEAIQEEKARKDSLLKIKEEENKKSIDEGYKKINID